MKANHTIPGSFSNGMMMMSMPMLSLLIATLSMGSGVDAHGYLESPRSRNYHASLDKVWWAEPGLPLSTPQPEDSPASLNVAGAACGINGSGRNYDYPKNIYGDPLPTIIQACYAPGDEIELKTKLTVGHDGHFEYKVCPLVEAGGVASQDCFDRHKLEFVSDELYNMPKHDEYTERAYIPWGVSQFKHKYRLPEDVEGDNVLIQWTYVTANTCVIEGYDTYNFPMGTGPLRSDSEGYNNCTDILQPEKFWNCAEVKISNDCSSSSPTPAPVDTRWYVKSNLCWNDGLSASWDTKYDTRHECCNTAMNWNYEECMGGDENITLEPTNKPTLAPIPSPTVVSPTKNPTNVPTTGTPTKSPVTPYQTTQPTNSPTTSEPTPAPTRNPVTLYPTRNPVVGGPPAIAGGDSRVIAYVANWQTCPTPEQLDGYTHIIIAFAVSYSYSASKNICDVSCNISTPTVQLCSGQTGNEIAQWKAAGKKVILSFGGAGMGGSWSGDVNDCWDHCFEKEEQLSTNITTIVSNQGFDGVDLDYEYCYDTENNRHGRDCNNSSTGKYSDAKAKYFLEEMTILLRQKLDVIGSNMELTHAPMDSDLGIDSPYFQLLARQNGIINFLMPQFYNGFTRPAIDGFNDSRAGQLSAKSIYDNLVNNMFQGQASKVVFGFCISDCAGTGSNTSAQQAVQVMQEVTTAYSCNGGAFFWVHTHDVGGTWSDAVYNEVSPSAGCSEVSSPTPPPTNAEPIPQPTLSPTPAPTNEPTPVPTTSVPTTVQPTNAPTSTKSPTNEPEITMYSGKFYIDWDIDHGRCVKDCEGPPPCGGEMDSWEVGHETEEACCATIPYKTYEECTYKLNPFVGSTQPTTPSDTRWYPGDEKCLNDGNAPTWENRKYTEQTTCCTNHFNWAYWDCMDQEQPPSYKWYIDWNGRKCVVDCDVDDQEFCGGKVVGTVTLHETKTDCCNAHLSYTAGTPNDCMFI